MEVEVGVGDETDVGVGVEVAPSRVTVTGFDAMLILPSAFRWATFVTTVIPGGIPGATLTTSEIL
jgi:hypothetical protein